VVANLEKAGLSTRNPRPHSTLMWDILTSSNSLGNQSYLTLAFPCQQWSAEQLRLLLLRLVQFRSHKDHGRRPIGLRDDAWHELMSVTAHLLFSTDCSSGWPV